MSERCLKVWENVWQGVKALPKSADRHAALDAIFSFAFDGVEPKLTGSAAGIFAVIRPLLTVYGSGKAFSGSLGGESGVGSAKSRPQATPQATPQAKRKQHRKPFLNENENEKGNLPPKSPKGEVGGGRLASDGLPEDPPENGRYPDPVTREEFAAIVHDMQTVHGPAGDAITDDEAAEWWNSHREEGWIIDGRQVRGATTVRQLLAGLHRKNKKNISARAAEPAGGSSRVFTLQEDEE